jgi:hypothetical protein
MARARAQDAVDVACAVLVHERRGLRCWTVAILCMSMLGTLKEVLAASSQSTNRGDGSEESKGAYWCDDCDQRILDLDVEGEAPPACPECGDEMTFERSPGSTGCAC